MRLKPTQTWPEIIGYAVGAIVIALLSWAFQAWLLEVVLGWFGVTQGFWKCAVIIFLVNVLINGSRSSK
jgi:hypothetical protein